MRPTVGRIVLFGPFKSNEQLEHPAIITRVWSDTLVNLVVFPDAAAPVIRLSVALLAADDQNGHYWRWPDRVDLASFPADAR